MTSQKRNSSALVIRTVPLQDLLEHPNQPRFDDREEIEVLKASIQEEGMLNPPIVVHHPTQGGKFYLIAGHRRILAVRELGWKTAEVVVNENVSGDALAPLVENVVKKNLIFIEYAKSIATVYNSAKGGELTFTDIGRMIGRDRNFVSRAVRVGSLPKTVIKRFYDLRDYRFTHSDKIMAKIAEYFEKFGKQATTKLIKKLSDKEKKSGFNRDLFLEMVRLELSLSTTSLDGSSTDGASSAANKTFVPEVEPEDPFAEFEAMAAAPDETVSEHQDEHPKSSPHKKPPEVTKQGAGYRFVDDGEKIAITLSKDRLTASSAQEIAFLLRKLASEIL